MRQPIFLIGIILLLILAYFLSQPSSNIISPPVLGCEDLNRGSYPVSPAVFELLPSIPGCFVSITHAFQSKNFSNAYFFSRNYYLQPEFFPGFVKINFSPWTNPSPTHYGAIGFGSFPREDVVEIPRGSQSRVRFFMYSGFGVRTYQGVRLSLVFDPESVNSTIRVSLDEESVSGFLLGPTFPKFTPMWVKPVDVVVDVPPSAAGTITLTIQTQPLSDEQQNRLSLPPYAVYQDATSYMGSLPIFRLTIVPV